MIHRRIHFIFFAISLGSFLILLRIVYISNDNYESSSNNESNSNVKNMMYKTLNIKPKIYNEHDIELILEKTRSKIRRDMSNYNFSDSDVSRLEDLQVESGGTPVRSIIVSTWRSGSTFFGELLKSVPGTYYHFEPLTSYQVQQISKPSETVKAIKFLKNVIKCNEIDIPGYFGSIPGNYGPLFLKYVLGSIWKHCIGNEELCLDPDFTSRVCKLFPLQSMKIVRLRLKAFEELLKDEQINLKIVFLVRDPRGVMCSRRKEAFCCNLHCTEPEILCAHMTRDYVAASRLIEKYPDRLMVVRFEDLVFDLFNNTRKILKFLKLSMTPSVGEFLRKHTKSYQPGLVSTFRISQDVPFKWKYGLDFDYVDDLQLVCKKAMDLWGYELAHNASHMTSKDFYPIKPYTITHQYL